MTESTGTRLDPALVSALRAQLVAEGRGLWRYALRKFITRYLPLSVVAYAIWVGLFVDLPDGWMVSVPELFRVVIKPLILAMIWTATDVAAVHRSATRPDATIAETAEDLTQANPRRWLREGLRNGAIMAVSVGSIVGTLMAFTTVPEDLPGQSRLMMIAVMIGVTLAWALPMMLLMAWARNRMLLRSRDMLDRSGLRG
jgi:hypothetical protein